MVISEDTIKKFQTNILSWYRTHKRDLPWRQTRDPYAILVSEVMLQQTQVSRVIPKYIHWLQTWPTVTSLAAAKMPDVLKVWSGLGYNRRALYLQKTAQTLVEQSLHPGWPQTEEALVKLPGIGKYTARALLCFAFDQQVAVVDTNIRKVLLTQFREGEKSNKRKELPLTGQEIWELAERLVPGGRAYEWNQALMDYAATELKTEKIPIPKQSKFIGSRRYYRGQIIQFLLQKKWSTLSEIAEFLRKDNRTWLRELVKEMREEGFIDFKNGKIFLTPD